MHSIVYVVFARGDTVCVSDVDVLSVHGALHAVVLVEDHVSILDCPSVIVVCDESKLTCGNGLVSATTCGAETVTVIACSPLPPSPVHEILYVVVVDGETVSDPDIAELFPHDDVHVVALVELQDNLVLCPWVRVEGDASSVTVAG